jgi:hypothetical protein
MITQTENYRTAAANKLNEEYKTFKGDRYQQVMKSAVRDALLNFIEQDNEFAQAVAQGGTFGDCMKAVSKGVSSSISDIDAYKRAVQYYFPGADISFTMTIKLNPHEKITENAPADSEQKPAEAPKASALSLSLDDLF